MRNCFDKRARTLNACGPTRFLDIFAISGDVYGNLSISCSRVIHTSPSLFAKEVAGNTIDVDVSWLDRQWYVCLSRSARAWPPACPASPSREWDWTSPPHPPPHPPLSSPPPPPPPSSLESRATYTNTTCTRMQHINSNALSPRYFLCQMNQRLRLIKRSASRISQHMHTNIYTNIEPYCAILPNNIFSSFVSFVGVYIRGLGLELAWGG